MTCTRTSHGSCQPGKVQAELVGSNSPVADGRDSNQAEMSLVFHLTAAGPTLTGAGNSPFLIKRYIEERLNPEISSTCRRRSNLSIILNTSSCS